MATLSVLAYYIYIETRTVFLVKGYEVIVLLDTYIQLPVERSIIHTIAWAQNPWIFFSFFFLTYGVYLGAILLEK